MIKPIVYKIYCFASSQIEPFVCAHDWLLVEIIHDLYKGFRLRSTGQKSQAYYIIFKGEVILPLR